MTIPSRPSETKSQVRKAGDVLRSRKGDLTWALDLASRWRACHAYPLNTFNSTLRQKVAGYHDPIVAQRLKRMPTIIAKLRREHSMQLTTMQDIAGVRAVLNSNRDVYKLADSYKKSVGLRHELQDEDDYIKNPRSTDGYRSLHLVYKYHNKNRPEYDGLLIELQIRTKLQHAWATAVETVGMLLSQALKNREGDKKWLDFFAIVSSAFAHMENSPQVPQFSSLSKQQVFKKVAEATDSLNAWDYLTGIPLAVNMANKSDDGHKWHFHLIVLDLGKKEVSLRSYGRRDLVKAMTDYRNIEREIAQSSSHTKVPVLVSAGKIRELRRAYPNFFLDIQDFRSQLERIVSKSKNG